MNKLLTLVALTAAIALTPGASSLHAADKPLRQAQDRPSPETHSGRINGAPVPLFGLNAMLGIWQRNTRP
jgi:hypothetical protein